MQNFIGGSDVRLVVPLLAGNLPIIPTPGTVTYSVYDHTGTAVPGLVNMAVETDVATFALSLDIPATEISQSKSFERRTVVVNLIANGQGHMFTKQYRLTRLLNHSVTPNDVRSFIGINEKELPDESIDLMAAYFHVEEDFAPSILSDLLTTGTTIEIAANEAIRLRAVIELLPSIRQRLTQMESNGVFQFKRAEIGKFEELRSDAWERYQIARATATNRALLDVTFVVTTQDTDPLTGG